MKKLLLISTLFFTQFCLAQYVISESDTRYVEYMIRENIEIKSLSSFDTTTFKGWLTVNTDSSITVYPNSIIAYNEDLPEEYPTILNTMEYYCRPGWHCNPKRDLGSEGVSSDRRITTFRIAKTNDTTIRLISKYHNIKRYVVYSIMGEVQMDVNITSPQKEIDVNIASIISSGVYTVYAELEGGYYGVETFIK